MSYSSRTASATCTRLFLAGALLAVAVVAACARPAPTAKEQTPDPVDVETSLQLPTRRVPERLAPPEPRAVPDWLVDPVGVTLVLETTRTVKDSPSVVTTQTIARGANHVHVDEPSEAHEWLFEQNPLDARRVSGYFVDHGTRQIICYDESALRNEQGIDGWASVAAFRIDPLSIESVAGTGRRTRLADHEFEEFRPTPSLLTPLTRLSWNRELAAPSGFELDDGRSVVTARVKTLHVGTNPELFAPPATRFPSYAMKDVADWREEH